MRTARSLQKATPTLLAVLLIAGMPLIQAIHLAKCESHGVQSCGHGLDNLAEISGEPSLHGCSHEACAHPHGQVASAKGEEEPKQGCGGYHNDPSACPACQIYMALAKGFTISTPPAQIDVAQAELISLVPSLSAPVYEHFSTAFPRAPPHA